MDELILGNKKFKSRMILGTGKYPSLEIMQSCHKVANVEMVTVSLRRIPLGKSEAKSMIDFIDLNKISLLPNTAGISTSSEALKLAQMTKALKQDFLKLEVTGDLKTLLPDSIETLKSVELIKKSYDSKQLFLMVYTNDDPVMAMRLYDAGADAVMPAGSPIGSGRGIQNTSNIRLIVDKLSGKVPLILDAGIGCASDATVAMELGMDGVLLNSAVALAQNSVLMAEAIKLAVEAGRNSYLAGRIAAKLYATASTEKIDFNL